MMKKINDIIGDAKTIGIAGHVRPDGDCMGSCMSLYNYLKKNRPVRCKGIFRVCGQKVQYY